jgi:phenylalanyl-tRNA synthetase beta subunit
LSLKNPTAPEVRFLRDNLLFSLLGVIEKNFRNFDEIKVFDIGKIWYIYKEKINNINDFNIENLRLFNKDKIPQNIVEDTKI